MAEAQERPTEQDRSPIEEIGEGRVTVGITCAFLEHGHVVDPAKIARYDVLNRSVVTGDRAYTSRRAIFPHRADETSPTPAVIHNGYTRVRMDL